VKIAILSKRGGRPYNQDYADRAEAGDCFCLAVADGLGAYSGSEVAGETAVKAALKWFKRAMKKDEDPFSGAAVNKLFKYAHNAIHKVKNDAPELKHSCTTLSVVITDGKRLIAAHEGDTRVYFFKSGSVEFYSKDHSLARLAADRGEISYNEIRTHKDQNKLTRVLGSDYFVQPDFKIYEQCEKDDAIIICTDGFWEYVYEQDMETALASPDTADAALEEMERTLLERAPDGNDNYTAAIMLFGGAAKDSGNTDTAGKQENASAENETEKEIDG